MIFMPEIIKKDCLIWDGKSWSFFHQIVNINLVRDKKTGKSKGFAFLCYEDQRSTILAVDNFNGIRVRIEKWLIFYLWLWLSGMEGLILLPCVAHMWQ